jgi:hypothetical protein
MTCQELLERASEAGGEDLADPAVRAHLEQCGACRLLMADLRRIQEEAGTLSSPPLPSGAWQRIERRLESAGARRLRTPAQALSQVSWTWLAVAAALLLAVGASVWIASGGLASRGPAGVPAIDGPAAATGPGQPPGAIEDEVRLAAGDYQEAIAGLEQVATAEDSPLDPAIAAALRENLEVLDQAIDESRVALEKQPENRVAQESLFEAFRRKVGLLQDTIALMNEMRKGDETGAARIIEDLNKS